jgi:hypothetical protein
LCGFGILVFTSPTLFSSARCRGLHLGEPFLDLKFNDYIVFHTSNNNTLPATSVSLYGDGEWNQLFPYLTRIQKYIPKISDQVYILMPQLDLMTKGTSATSASSAFLELL